MATCLVCNRPAAYTVVVSTDLKPSPLPTCLADLDMAIVAFAERGPVTVTRIV